ncbi:MAG: glycosyltransferase family protein [Geminicoccaceae bacterium]
MNLEETNKPSTQPIGDALGIDAVIMLTWSDWQTEPRSNRYHYATRLAKQVPVLFCQVLGKPGDKLAVTPSGHDNIDIVNFSLPVAEADVQEFRRLLYARGIRKPLIWIYNILNFGLAVKSFPSAPKVFHATEDYFTPTTSMTVDINVMRAAFTDLQEDVDLLVAVSPGVLKSFRRNAQYRGPAIVIENGCDASFFFDIADKFERVDEDPKAAPVAIFQGGINARLDYELLERVIDHLPDWQFRFCGNVVESEAWRRLVAKPNVSYLGVLQPDEIGRAMCAATVGLIPFVADRWIRNSLPLKAFEYVASGLPVVTVPIDALQGRGEVFDIAEGADDFVRAITKAASGRNDPAKRAARRKAATENSYDHRFTVLVDRLQQRMLEEARQSSRRLKVGVLYDVESVRVGTVGEHLEAFDRYSKNEITYIPATRAYWSTLPESEMQFDFSILHVLIVHYSVRLSIDDHIPPAIAEALKAFAGLKVLFIQDEYDNTETARRWMDRIAFDLIYSCVPKDQREIVYPSYRYPASEFRQTLTGYIPEGEGLETFAMAPEDRRVLIGYRGRRLAYVYGDLGQEKHQIGVMVRERAEAAGLDVDIEVDDDKRLYGDSWYAFLGSARATLGTESGANIFDFTGCIARDIEDFTKNHPDADYDEVRSAVLKDHEGTVRMNQVSPKIFEAILLRTALVLFEGNYSGVIEADKHYLALKKDYSNLDAILNKIQDVSLIKAMTERAYRDVILSGRYAYQTFVQGVDEDIANRMLKAPRERPCLVAATILGEDNHHRAAWPLIPSHVSGAGTRAVDSVTAGLVARPVVRVVDLSMRAVLMSAMRRILRFTHRQVVLVFDKNPLIHREVQRVWKGLPDRFRVKVKRALHS